MPLVQGQVYSIINTATNTFLDLSGADNSTIQGWQDNGGLSNQKWVALIAGDGWIFKNARTGGYLSVGNYAGGPSTRVISSNIPVVWDVKATQAANTYNVQLPLLPQPLTLDLSGSSVKDGTSVIVYTPNGNPNQAWKFVTS